MWSAIILRSLGLPRPVRPSRRRASFARAARCEPGNTKFPKNPQANLGNPQGRDDRGSVHGVSVPSAPVSSLRLQRCARRRVDYDPPISFWGGGNMTQSQALPILGDTNRFDDRRRWTTRTHHPIAFDRPQVHPLVAMDKRVMHVLCHRDHEKTTVLKIGAWR